MIREIHIGIDYGSVNPTVFVPIALCLDDRKISWSRYLRKQVELNKSIVPNASLLTESIYRPFFKQNCYFNKFLNNCTYQLPKLFPYDTCDNIVICVSGKGGNKDNPIFIANTLVDYNLLSAGSKCLPLYWYEENKNKQRSLFDEESNNDYIRRDGITDWILKEVRTRYGAKNITKEMIFYYVYGLLHSKDYRERFAADLKKSLPRIPIVERVEDFARKGNLAKVALITYTPEEVFIFAEAETGEFGEVLNCILGEFPHLRDLRLGSVISGELVCYIS